VSSAGKIPARFITLHVDTVHACTCPTMVLCRGHWGEKKTGERRRIKMFKIQLSAFTKKKFDGIKVLNPLIFWKKTSAIKSCCMR